MVTFSIKAPPEGVFCSDISLVHKICEFYKKIYVLSQKISKRDKLGIFSKIENNILEVLNLSLSASFETKYRKISFLNSARIKIEILKRLIRITSELEIINNKKYIEFEFDLIEISKMTNGWIKFLQENPR